MANVSLTPIECLIPNQAFCMGSANSPINPNRVQENNNYQVSPVSENGMTDGFTPS